MFEDDTSPQLFIIALYALMLRTLRYCGPKAPDTLEFRLTHTPNNPSIDRYRSPVS